VFCQLYEKRRLNLVLFPYVIIKTDNVKLDMVLSTNAHTYLSLSKIGNVFNYKFNIYKNVISNSNMEVV